MSLGHYYFYSHIPCGMWRIFCITIICCNQFLLTHPVWDVTGWRVQQVQRHNISTHTSRVGCDVHSSNNSSSIDISTHTSRVGCDFLSRCCCSTLCLFLLTHPVWDVTTTQNKRSIIGVISTHTSRVGCDSYAFVLLCFIVISTHTSRVGCDDNSRCY